MQRLFSICAAGCTAIVAGQSAIAVQTSAGTVDAATAVQSYMFANNSAGISSQKSSFALSDDGTFARVSWGISDYATQGSFIVEKAVAMDAGNGRIGVTMVRNWLLKLPLTPEGRAFGTEGGELHMGGQGAFEGTAEVLLMARHYAAHTGDMRAFTFVPERLVCWTDATGNVKLAGVGHPGLEDSACAANPGTFLEPSLYGPQFYPEGPISPSTVTFGNATVKTTLNAHAKALAQYVTLPAPWSSVSVAVTAPGSGIGGLQAIVQADNGNVVINMPVPNNIKTGWLTISAPAGTTLPAGTYSVQLAPTAQPSGPGSAFSLQWVTDSTPAANGSSTYYTYLGQDYHTAVPQLSPTYTLSSQLLRALQWQLGLMSTGPGQFDVLVIRDSAYRGSAEAAVNSGSSYYDLLRMGFAASYINLRVLESLAAYAEMAEAEAVPAYPGLTTAIQQVALAVGDRFGNPSDGTFVTWYGCTCVDASTNTTTCALDNIKPGSTDPCLQTFAIDFLPTQALAVKLGVVAGPSNGGTYATTVAALQRLRDAGRYGAGQFRTNTIPIEQGTPMAWIAADRWNDKTGDGYAVREWNQTGDWMMFNSTAPDGNGNYGLQEENGGRLLSTSVFMFETGNGNAAANMTGLPAASPYPELLSDWAAFVNTVTNVTLQLEARDYSSPPLSWATTPLGRTGMVQGGLPQHLCAVPRGSGSLSKLDLFGKAWCDYYKTVSFDLPEAGLPIYSFVKGMLGLYVRADGGLFLMGVRMMVPGSTIVALPSGWPQEATSVTVKGLNVGPHAATMLTCTVTGGMLSCTVTLSQEEEEEEEEEEQHVQGSASQYVITDAQGLGPRFDGVGAISGGGATSRFLPDYDPAIRSQILDYLFTPNFGASLHWLKVEIGGEALATEGSEPSHMRLPPGQGDEDYTRGYEWLVMTEAKARNPDILLYGLPWTWPGWVGDAEGRDPWSRNVSWPAAYITAWVHGAKTVHNLTINVLGTWNERYDTGNGPLYMKELRKQLDAMGHTDTAILCDDSKYYCAPQVLADPELAQAVAFMGGHDPATPQATQTGKPVWYSEDFHAKGGESGAGTWASQINRRYLQYNMTATLAWNAVASFYSGLSFDNTGLMSAQYPWAGSYAVLGTIWATAHTTQFTKPGWNYGRNVGSGGQGAAGMLAQGGSYVTYADTTGGDFTIVIEKFSNEGNKVTQQEDAQVCLAGRFATGKGAGPLQVWQSTFAVQPGEKSSYLVQQPAVTPDPTTHCFTLTIPVDSVTTITTLTSGGKGSHPTPAQPSPFPLPYSDDFEGCVPPAAGKYWADISGSWECVSSGDPSHGMVTRMATPAKPISWEHDYRPHSVLGDMNWANVAFTVDVLVPQNVSGATAVVGVRCTLLNQTDYNALMNEISFPGLWWAVNATGGWGLYSSIQGVGDNTKGILIATGAPVPVTPGAWMTLSLTVSGKSLSATVNGQAAVSDLDVSAYPYTGWVGLGTGDYGQPVLFDNVKVAAA